MALSCNGLEWTTFPEIKFQYTPELALLRFSPTFGVAREPHQLELSVRGFAPTETLAMHAHLARTASRYMHGGVGCYTINERRVSRRPKRTMNKSTSSLSSLVRGGRPSRSNSGSASDLESVFDSARGGKMRCEFLSPFAARSSLFDCRALGRLCGETGGRHSRARGVCAALREVTGSSGCLGEAQIVEL